ncbi:hypothetical protein OURE66S_03545 [Oligella ureolytica]|uniref:hypothetical protein n=1 Tax=Oligella urethralis TaxID=90245 RepID=UPI0006607243|nr:hypothetical protein [Oligella urethralis]
MNVDDFMANEEPKRKGKLIKWKNELETLYDNGYSYASMVRFLEANGVRVQHAAVRQFCLRHFVNEEMGRNKLNNVKSNEEVAEDEVKRPTEQTSSETPNLTDSKVTKDEEVPADRRFPSWSNLGPEYKSIDDLI